MGEKYSFQSQVRMSFIYSRKELFAFFLGCLFSMVLLSGVVHLIAPVNQFVVSLYQGPGDTSIPMVEFPEPQWRTDQTLDIKTITSTPFARFEIHTVKTESGAVINDWLWTDERSHVNILVHLKKEDKYMLFRQKKYGLERPYYATVGGLFNEGDTSIKCAQRELLEETGLEAERWVSLGRYRVQVNRGGGILYAYLAKNCVPSKKSKKSDDYEKQVKTIVSHEQLVHLALSGEIGEAQWVATVALGLLHDEHMEKNEDVVGNVTASMP